MQVASTELSRREVSTGSGSDRVIAGGAAILVRVLSESQLVEAKVVVGAGCADVLVRIERAARTVSTIRPVYSVNYVAGLYPP